MVIKEQLKVKIVEFFNLFNRKYELNSVSTDNIIAVRRIQNAIQQIDLYRISIIELLNGLGDEKWLNPEEAENLLKLLFEYIALADSINRSSKDFFLKSEKITKGITEALIRYVNENIKSDPESEEDNSALTRLKVLNNDIVSLLNFWDS